MAGNEPDPPPNNTEVPREDPFALVGHEIRTEIIQVLSPDHAIMSGNDLSLSELRSRLDTDVEPSQLHYHLQQLTGHFVEKTDDGYLLNSVGMRLSWVLCAGSLDRRQEQREMAAGFDCYYCQGRVEAMFDEGYARIECSECDHVYMTDYYPLPIDAFEDDPAAFAHYNQYMIVRILSLARRVCPICGHLLTTEFRSLDEAHNRTVTIDHSCDSCGSGWWQSVGMALLGDPGLIAFCYDHGIDLLSTPHWDLEFAATDKYVTVRSTDPWEVALRVTIDGDTLELVVDGDLNVLERNRLGTSNDRSASSPNDVQSGGQTTGSSERGDEVVLPDKTACLQSLRRHRWPDGVMCPHCDSADLTKEGTTSKAAQCYRCHTCDSIFNDLTGTIFGGRGLSVPEMCYIIRELEETKTAQIALELDRSYKSVLDFVHEVQDAGDEDTEFDLTSVCEAK